MGYGSEVRVRHVMSTYQVVRDHLFDLLDHLIRKRSTDQSLHGIESVGWVGDGLSSRRHTDYSFSCVEVCMRMCAFVRNNTRFRRKIFGVKNVVRFIQSIMFLRIKPKEEEEEGGMMRRRRGGKRMMMRRSRSK